MTRPRFNRILLKLSGEALMSSGGSSLVRTLPGRKATSPPKSPPPPACLSRSPDVRQLLAQRAGSSRQLSRHNFRGLHLAVVG